MCRPLGSLWDCVDDHVFLFLAHVLLVKERHGDGAIGKWSGLGHRLISPLSSFYCDCIVDLAGLFPFTVTP